MTNSLQEDFYFQHDMWQLRPNGVERFGYDLKIFGGERLFESPEANEAVRKSLVKADALIRIATEYAHESVYLRDIQECGGITLLSIYFESWERARVWFQLNGPEDRLLGVLLLADVPSDVHCEPPG